VNLANVWRRLPRVLMAARPMATRPAHRAVRKDPPASIQVAVYALSNAYNAPQMWKKFSLEATRRYSGYAREIDVNAFRVWASYEFWKMEPAKFETELDPMLGLAHENGIRTMVSTFENKGAPRRTRICGRRTPRSCS
jgi:hypothetical protein